MARVFMNLRSFANLVQKIYGNAQHVDMNMLLYAPSVKNSLYPIHKRSPHIVRMISIDHADFLIKLFLL